MNPTVKDTLFCMDCQLHYPRHEAVPVFNPKGVKVRSRCPACSEKVNALRAMKPEERDKVWQGAKAGRVSNGDDLDRTYTYYQEGRGD